MEGMEKAYFETKAKVMALAAEYQEGSEATRRRLRRIADFFPVAKSPDDRRPLRSLVIRVNGRMFLVEDTHGGETGVFSLLLPVI